MADGMAGHVDDLGRLAADIDGLAGAHRDIQRRQARGVQRIAHDPRAGHRHQIGHRLDMVGVVMGQRDQVQRPVPRGKLGQNRGGLGGVDQRGPSVAVQKPRIVVGQATDGDKFQRHWQIPLFAAV